MNVHELEEHAGEHADRVLALIEESNREGVRRYVDRLDRTEMAWLVLALANTALQQESSNTSLEVRLGILKRRNETLEAANVNLFRERRALADSVSELRDLMDERASTAPARKVKC